MNSIDPKRNKRQRAWETVGNVAIFLLVLALSLVWASDVANRTEDRLRLRYERTTR